MPHLSFSQVETFRCPKRWHGEKVLKVGGGPNEFTLLGSAFHEAVEAFGVWRNGAGRARPFDPVRGGEALALDFRERLARLAAAEGLDALVPELTLRGRAMIAAFAHAVAPHYFPLVVEDPFDVPIPGKAPDPSGEPWTFQGKIDAITAPPVGGLALVDFKTASKPWPAGKEHQTLQAEAYLLAELLRGVRPLPRRVTFLVFPTRWDAATGAYECRVDVRTTERTLEQVGAFAQKLRDLAATAEALYAGAEPAASPSPLCGYCPLLERCEPGREYHEAWKERKARRGPAPAPDAEATGAADVVEIPPAARIPQVERADFDWIAATQHLDHDGEIPVAPPAPPKGGRRRA